MVRSGPQGLSRITRVIWLHNKVTVDKEVHDYWIKQLYTRKYKVQIPKLTQNDIDDYNKVPVETWMNIDPYSDLEDVGDTSSDEPPTLLILKWKIQRILL